MTLKKVSILQQLDDEFRQQNIAAYLERKKRKETNKEHDQSVESRLAYLELEVQKLKEKIQSTTKQ